MDEPPRIQYSVMPLVMPNPDNSPIKIEKIRKKCSAGLSECPFEDRTYAWLALLGVFPKHPNDWMNQKQQMLDQYHDYRTKLCPDMENWHKLVFPVNVPKHSLPCEDKDLMFLIHGDIVRTGRHICFFDASDPSPEADPKDGLAPFAEPMRRIERVLYIFAKLNPSLSYMQGFNELVCPFYYNFCHSTLIFDDEYDEIEAAVLACLQRLMTTDLANYFITQGESAVVMAQLDQFQQLIERRLPKTGKILKDLNLHPLQWSYKWLSLLFSQEYDLPSLLIIWDSLFAHFENLIEYLQYVALGHIRTVESKLSSNDFTTSISVLQSVQVQNVYPILREADAMFTEDHSGSSISAKVKSVFGFNRK